MKQFKQPSIFISHGTIYEAMKNVKLQSEFKEIRKEYIRSSPKAIVLFSGHWQTEMVTVTTNHTMVQMDEGFPPEFLSEYRTLGDPTLARRIIEILNKGNIKTKENHIRGLDHGALIPLLLLFPDEQIPVIQVSLQNDLDPSYHKIIAELLNPLRDENILFIGSGGLVHNRHEIERFSGHKIKPDSWAKDFDEFITSELNHSTDVRFVDKLISAYNHNDFKKSHPTTEHYLPLVIASAFDGLPTKIYENFQWKNLSMSAFLFE